MRVPDGAAATSQTTAECGAGLRVLTTFHLDDDVGNALRAGASGFLLKDVDASRLLEAIRVVHAGDAIVHPAVTRRPLDRFAHRLPASAREDSPRPAGAPSSDRLTASTATRTPDLSR